MQVTDRRGILHHTWVIVVYTINIGPYLHLIGINSRTYQCRCIIAATTLQVVIAAFVIHADETLGYIYPLLVFKIKQRHKMLTDITEVGFTVYCKTHELECVQEFHIDTLLLHVECHHVGRHYLALGNNLLLKFIGQRLESQLTEMSEYLIDFLCCSLGSILAPVEFLDCLHILCLQHGRVLARTVGIAVP